VSGGPGTGKTSLTVRLLKALLTLSPDDRIALAAPTGKAAHRMMQAIEEKIGDWPPSLLERLPKTAQTLHRLIGTPMYGVTPKFHQGHPLPIDYLVIDEASMMDLSLASRVFDALPPSCRVLLLGDKNQLSSVESGAVFAELMASSSRPFAAESAHVIELTESYRFTETSGIGRLADAVREGNTTAALALLKAPACTALDVRLQAPLGTRPSPDELAGLASPYADYWALMAQEKMRSTDEVLHAFDRYRVLCALEVGPWGARHLGLELDELFRARAGRGGALWYPGRAIMITRNDPELGLVNGEIGIARETPTGDLRVEFMSLAETPRSFAPQRLAHFAVAYAITIHKSQGSELDEVTVVLPYDDSPMLTRELLYTAITRARRQVVVIAKEAAVESAILTPTLRLSGLRDRIQDVMENRI
jgi:exodeoxyribonuclease V alpha subunit